MVFDPDADDLKLEETLRYIIGQGKNHSENIFEVFSKSIVYVCKKLSDKRRRELMPVIKEQAIAYGIGMASHEEIDQINILQATFLAMERALAQLEGKAKFALIDGNREKDFGLPVMTVVKGDSRSANIAAASILAKVTRDDLMEALAEEYPQYGFEIHKGYGTKAHYEALRTYGPSPIHRMTFLKKFYGEK